MYTLYCSLFQPYLSYSNDIWVIHVKCLFTLQKKAIRLICNADRLAHTNVLFKDMSILKLSEFVKYKTNCYYDVQFIPWYLTDSVAKEVYQIFERTFYTSK